MESFIECGLRVSCSNEKEYLDCKDVLSRLNRNLSMYIKEFEENTFIATQIDDTIFLLCDVDINKILISFCVYDASGDIIKSNIDGSVLFPNLEIFEDVSLGFEKRFNNYLSDIQKGNYVISSPHIQELLYEHKSRMNFYDRLPKNDYILIDEPDKNHMILIPNREFSNCNIRISVDILDLKFKLYVQEPKGSNIEFKIIDESTFCSSHDKAKYIVNDLHKVCNGENISKCATYPGRGYTSRKYDADYIYGD